MRRYPSILAFREDGQMLQRANLYMIGFAAWMVVWRLMTCAIEGLPSSN